MNLLSQKLILISVAQRKAKTESNQIINSIKNFVLVASKKQPKPIKSENQIRNYNATHSQQHSKTTKNQNYMTTPSNQL